MTATTEIIPFATDPSADVESQADYEADPQTATGFVSGVAESAKLNKVWRQSSFMAAGLASFCVQEGVSVPDDGNLSALVTEITTALQVLINATVQPPFAAGTRIVFQQALAPTGWVKDVSLDNRALRVSGGAVGTGGSVAFTTVFAAGLSAGAHALTTAEMPSHSHAITDPGHVHALNTNLFIQGASSSSSGAGPNAVGTVASGPGGLNTSAAATGITEGATGGGGTHTHSLNLDVTYVDVIVAQKS